MSAPTPGPWRVLEAGRTEDDGNACRPLTIAGPGDDDLANVYSASDSTVAIPRAEAIANAHLMAASPALLAVIYGAPIISMYHGHRGFEANRFIEDYAAWRERVYIATAKAEGRS